MKAQSEPEGQQMTDCTSPLLKDMHVESVGQQKSEGKLPPHCCRPETPPHVCACLRKRLDACVDVIADVRRRRTDILDSLGKRMEDLMAVVMQWRCSGDAVDLIKMDEDAVELKTVRVPDSRTVGQKEKRGNEQTRETKETI